MQPIRHFTATAFVVHEDRLALHWHPKVKAWLPPGGHIEANEEPAQAALREAREETGLQARIVPTGPDIPLTYPPQTPAPFVIMIEDIDDPVQGFHHHIDMIYFCDLPDAPGPLNEGWRWVSRRELEEARPLTAPNGVSEPPPEDVRILAMHAFEIAGRPRANG